MPTMTRRISSSSWTGTAVVAALVLLHPFLVPSVYADKDGNVYSFGSNPNIRQRMYWADSKAVLDDLSQFSALYIKFHNCAWSPNQAFFDDDGENRDGDENWYQGRTPFYAANAGFSLYGAKRFAGGCTKASYINSFFTINGADVLIQALGLGGNNNNNGQSGSYCQGYNGDESDAQSAMMGCDDKGNFVTALFTDEYCQGKYFANVTLNDGQYNSYGTLLNRMGCKKIWSGKASTTSSGYESTAHEILMQSEVCDIDVNPACPDPWGKKTIYERNFALAQGGRSAAFEILIKKPLFIIATLFWMAGVGLLIYAYYIRFQEEIKARRAQTGEGKFRALMYFLVKDVWKHFKQKLGKMKTRRRKSVSPKKKRRKTKKKKRTEEIDSEFDEPPSPSIELT